MDFRIAARLNGLLCLTLCMLGNFSHFCRPLLKFYFKINFFKKIFQEYYQSVKWFGSRSGPTFWVQNVCKVYQQTIKIAPSKLKIKDIYVFAIFLSMSLDFRIVARLNGAPTFNSLHAG